MYINGIQAAKCTNILPKPNIKALSFKSGKDSFVKSTNITNEEFIDGLSESAKELIKNAATKISKNNQIKPLGVGADGSAYKIEGNNEYPQGLVIKISHTQDKNPENGEMQRVGCDFNNEKEILSSIKDFDKNSQNYVGYLKLSNGTNALITTFVNGKTPDIKNKNINTKSLSSLLNIMYQLDSKGVLHRDLKKENIFINNKDEAGICDFGASINYYIKDFDTNTNENNFPPFEAPTNLRNFEDTLLSPYIHELAKNNPDGAKNLFASYLNLKSEFHAKKYEDIQNELSKNNLNRTEREKLGKIADHEFTLSKVFKNPDKDIIETELIKNDITYNAELAYKNEVLLLNPLANLTLKMNALISAKKLEKVTENKLKRPNSIENKKYYEYKNQEAKFRQQKISGWTKGLTDWLLDCLTSDIKSAPDYKQEIINQCTESSNITDFEIPNISEIIGKE